jgi:hypothetical protein
MKVKSTFNINYRVILFSLGIIVLAGNLMVATKISKLWPLLVSIFFSFMDIYHAMYSMLNQFIS